MPEYLSREAFVALEGVRLGNPYLRCITPRDESQRRRTLFKMMTDRLVSQTPEGGWELTLAGQAALM